MEEEADENVTLSSTYHSDEAIQDIVFLTETNEVFYVLSLTQHSQWVLRAVINISNSTPADREWSHDHHVTHSGNVSHMMTV